MNLNEFILEVKDCTTNPKLFVKFKDRPGMYEVESIEFGVAIRKATLNEFNKAVKELTGPMTLVLEAEIPKPRS